MRLSFVALIFTVSISVPVHADSDFISWTAASATIDLIRPERGPSLWFDAHARRDEHRTVGILRPGVGYRLAPYFSIWVGYAFVPMAFDSGVKLTEHRLWEQGMFNYEGGAFTFDARSRVEHRFASGSVGHRFRQMLRLAFYDDGFGAFVSDEIFVQFNDTDVGWRAGYDQNRLYVGAILGVSEWLHVEPAYLMVHENALDRLSHGISVNFVFNR